VNNYLLTLVLKADLEDKARQELLDEVKKKVTSDKGQVTKEDLWGARDLAYPIKHQTKGFYAHFEFETDPAVAKTLDKQLKVEEDIIRFLLVRNEAKTSQSKQVKVAESKEDKGNKDKA